MNWFLIAVTLLIALVLIILEVVAVPGFTVFGIGGILLLIYAIYVSFSIYGTTAGILVMGGTLIAGVLLFAYFIRSKTWDRFKLKKEISGKVNTIDDLDLKEGETGKTLSRLAPIGKVAFGDRVVEASAIGELIDPETPVEITRIDGNKIFVKRITEENRNTII